MSGNLGNPKTERERIELIQHLSSFVTPERLARMRRALAQRTRYVSVVLEDIYQAHNASAVLRSCDGFGIQDVHIIENRNSYRINPGVELGTSRWLTLTSYREKENNTRDAIDALRQRGYRIVATSPPGSADTQSPDSSGSDHGYVRTSVHIPERIPEHIPEHKSIPGETETEATALEDFDLQKGKTALLFGNELEGLSDIAMEEADEYMYIPMYGFVESFNISVSCALSLHHLNYLLRKSKINWGLTEMEKTVIMLKWLRSSIKQWEKIEKEWRKNRHER